MGTPPVETSTPVRWRERARRAGLALVPYLVLGALLALLLWWNYATSSTEPRDDCGSKFCFPDRFGATILAALVTIAYAIGLPVAMVTAWSLGGQRDASRRYLAAVTTVLGIVGAVTGTFLLLGLAWGG